MKHCSADTIWKKLVAYMGDDRRGGHTWKFVSQDKVSSVNSKNNSFLFEKERCTSPVTTLTAQVSGFHWN
jgi:secreted PhoX family phosphatase